MLIMADKAKNRKSLSVSKKKGIINSGKSPNAGKSSITSFFSNPPPPKLACPLCGQLVPRFRINEHIDLQCEKFQREDSSIASANRSAESPTEIPTRDQTSSPKIRCMETKTSPYFKKQSSKQVHHELRSNNVVGTMDLGSLSSQLSKSSFKPLQDTCTMAGDEPPSTAIGKCSGALSSSQKKNDLPQVLVDKEICSLAIKPTSSPSHQSKKIFWDGPQAECKDVLEFKESKSIMFSSAVCVAESALPRLTKRKNKEAPVGRKSNLSKKGRYQMSTKLSTEDPPIKLPGGTEDLGVQLTEGSSSGSCCIMLNSSEGSEEPREESNTAKEAEDEPLESDDGTITEDRESAATPRLPYYLQNFLTVVEAVLENEDDRVLFNQEDQSVIQSFEKLSDTAQMLYVRLFQRKLKWLQVNKLDYDKISTNLAPVVQELVEKGFVNPEGDLQDLGEVLDLLPAFELKGLAKTFHLVRSVTHKQQVIEGLLRLSKQRSLFTMASSHNQIGAVMLKRAKQLAGSCVRLCRGPRAVFSRVLLLFSVTDNMEEEEMAAGGQGQLYTILMVKSGRLAFPDYTVQRSAKLFQDREDLIRYETAMRTLKDVITAMQAGHWEEALELYTTAKSAWQKLSETYDLSGQEELPVFLRCFTVGWTYTRIHSRGVEILQRLCRYEEAVEVLRSLLAQSKYCPDSRGRWWDRLALNLQQHLKLPEQAIAAIRGGLSDPLVRTGHQLSLHQRADRMKESPSFKKYRLQLRDLPTILVKDVPHVTIRGQLFPHEAGTGKSVFLRPADEEGDQNGDSMVMCSVEDLSLAYYRRQGFDQGIHGEGSTFSTLFGLLLWDIIFMEGIPDVFRNPYQTCPLDLFTDCFYENRKEAIETRVQMLEEMSVETLCSMLEEVWSTQEGRMCSLVSWERFSSRQQAQSLVSCLGGAFLGRIVTRMAKDYRHCRAGLPDLVVWNTSINSYKLVEVKGPSDRLSQKQQIWLDELQKMGADVEVCHVTAIGARGTRLD